MTEPAGFPALTGSFIKSNRQSEKFRNCTGLVLSFRPLSVIVNFNRIPPGLRRKATVLFLIVVGVILPAGIIGIPGPVFALVNFADKVGLCRGEIRKMSIKRVKLARRLAPGPFEVIHGENGGCLAGSVRTGFAMNKNGTGKFLESVEEQDQIVTVRETGRRHANIHPLQPEFVGYGFFSIVPGLPGVRAAKVDNAPQLVFLNHPAKIPARWLSGAV